MLDCLVIGGGAAGLTAAIYLHRYRRNALVIDAGQSRLHLIPKARNVPGFPDGISGPELLDRVREHAARFGVTLESGHVERLYLLATGARDVEPEAEGLADALKHALVRYCPV